MVFLLHETVWDIKKSSYSKLGHKMTKPWKYPCIKNPSPPKFGVWKCGNRTFWQFHNIFFPKFFKLRFVELSREICRNQLYFINNLGFDESSFFSGKKGVKNSQPALMPIDITLQQSYSNLKGIGKINKLQSEANKKQTLSIRNYFSLWEIPFPFARPDENWKMNPDMICFWFYRVTFLKHFHMWSTSQ